MGGRAGPADALTAGDRDRPGARASVMQEPSKTPRHLAAWLLAAALAAALALQRRKQAMIQATLVSDRDVARSLTWDEIRDILA